MKPKGRKLGLKEILKVGDSICNANGDFRETVASWAGTRACDHENRTFYRPGEEDSENETWFQDMKGGSK